ncbi:MAG: rhamnulokinase [Verrucomicrobiales bacterium]|nr:rhamnulokinase [Verrucomicrobiales bacterium]
MSTHHLAIDLGAESGRLMLGTLNEGLLSLKEVHRFPTGALRQGDSLHWDMARLFQDTRAGLRKASQLGIPVASISTDSWGVDYLLLRADGSILEPTYHYRDARTAQGVANAHAKISWPEIFAETGLQFMPLNTLYQLAAESPERLEAADRLLLIGDGFNHFLSGRAVAEVTLASTSMVYNPKSRSWSSLLCDRVGIPSRLLPPIVQAGSRLGPIRELLSRESGLARVEVVASCSHDTGAAVAAVPAEGGNWAYLSSGTWSLMGVERPEPVITDTARELNFTNEIGFGNTVRLLKNISGLWLLQECRRSWAAAGETFDYATLVRMAETSPAFVSLIQPADPRFLAPDDMPARIAAYCREIGEPVPATPGAMVRCIFESLALLYRRTREQLELITGTPIHRLHIVGGGSQNALLNQLAANALQVPVIAGPVEATAAGNLLTQAYALDRIPSLEGLREVVRRSFEVRRFEPADAEAWDAAYLRFTAFI